MVFATGCSIFTSLEGDRQGSLDEGRSLWNTAGITDYTIRLQRTTACFFCDTSDLVPDARLTVVADTLTEVFDIQNDVAVTQINPGVFFTINELFDFLQDAIDQDAAGFDVSYDGVLGYPTDIDIDISRRFVDDDVGFRVREFTELN